MPTLPAMRYGPSENLLRLARYLASTRFGATITDMESHLQVSRRTAERMRLTLEAIFPELTYTEDEARVRRWRLPATALTGLTAPSVDCLAAVEAAARDAVHTNQPDRAAHLKDAAATLRATLAAPALTRAETDIAALMEAEGLAMRPGPRPHLPRALLATLRRAILGMQVISVTYNSPTSGPTTRLLCPYGLLYGGRGWLVAHAETTSDLRLWRLDRITNAKPLDRSFPRAEHFSLDAYAARSFGVFQETPTKITLRFSADAADDAAAWHFHPTQTLHKQPDGSLIVSFEAGGTRELCWHLFTWGNTVQILTPDSLREEMVTMLTNSLAEHTKKVN